MQILFQGEILATPTAATILIEGESVFSGQIGAGQPLDAQIDIANVVSNGGAVSISVTSGILNVGQVFKWENTAPAWNNTTVYPANSTAEYNSVTWVTGGGAQAGYIPGVSNAWSTCQSMSNDCRTNILINGATPVYPATPPQPTGGAENPDWAGWAFEVSAGETITFTV
jgi:hypothetical protein